MLVFGDVILDWYWWGQASRLSPEAPVPVVRRQNVTAMPGGAGNTAANLAALGAAVSLCGITGEDAPAGELRAALSAFRVETPHLFCDSSRPTTTKTRVIAGHQQIVRVDEEETSPVPAELTRRILSSVNAELDRAAVVVVSDYGKGFVTAELLKTVITEDPPSRQRRVFIDPKGADFSRYRGAFLLKPNRLELGLLAGLPVETHADVLAAGRKLAALMPGTHIVVTEGSEGMTRFFQDEAPDHFEATPRQVFDVTGAGDTVLATLAMSIACGAAWPDAMRLASLAAGIAISRMGSAAVTLDELKLAANS